jgi:hypothetical protein
MQWSEWTNVLSDLDYIAVFVAAVAAFALGSVWFMPAVFGKTWMKLVGLKDKDVKDSVGKTMAATFLLTVLTAWGLAVLIKLLGVVEWVDGLTLGLFVGLLFHATATLVNSVYEQRSLVLWKISAGHAVLSLGVMGAVLALMS